MDNIENAVAHAMAISQVAEDMLYEIKYAESEVRNISGTLMSGNGIEFWTRTNAPRFTGRF